MENDTTKMDKEPLKIDLTACQRLKKMEENDLIMFFKSVMAEGEEKPQPSHIRLSDFLNVLSEPLAAVFKDVFAKKDLSNLSWEGGKRIIPAGSVIAFAGRCEDSDYCKILPGYLYCDGAEVSRDVYSDLFDAIGTIYGKGNYSSTFNLPDFRDMFLRGAGENSACIGTKQRDAIRNITGRQYFRWGCMVPKEENENSYKGSIPGDVFSAREWIGKQTHPRDGGSSCSLLGFDASKVVPTANENRPVNFAVNYYIKY